MKKFDVQMNGYDVLFKLNQSVSTAIQLMLVDIAMIVQNNAKINAPYKSGTLRRSINTDFYQLQRGIVVVGSPVRYSRIREYSNNLHPRTTFYLKRGYTEHVDEIKNIIETTLSRELNN